MSDETDTRHLRLFDLKPYEHIIVRCQCGHIVQYMPGVLQRRQCTLRYSDYDLQFRLHGSHCRAFNDFEIIIKDIPQYRRQFKAMPPARIVAKDR